LIPALSMIPMRHPRYMWQMPLGRLGHLIGGSEWATSTGFSSSFSDSPGSTYPTTLNRLRQILLKPFLTSLATTLSEHYHRNGGYA
jgi:hypothetical protein